MSIEKVSLKDIDPTAMVLMLQTPRGYEQKAIDALYDTIYELKTNPITQEEFEIANDESVEEFVEEAVEEVAAEEENEEVTEEEAIINEEIEEVLEDEFEM